MDRVLVRINVGAHLNMMNVVRLQLFGIHHVPALPVLVVHELNLVAFSLYRPLQRHEGRLGGHLVRRLRHGVLLGESSHAHHEGQSQQTNYYLFHGILSSRFLLDFRPDVYICYQYARWPETDWFFCLLWCAVVLWLESGNGLPHILRHNWSLC